MKSIAICVVTYDDGALYSVELDNKRALKGRERIAGGGIHTLGRKLPKRH